jgi:hypothetical protein
LAAISAAFTIGCVADHPNSSPCGAHRMLTFFHGKPVRQQDVCMR